MPGRKSWRKHVVSVNRLGRGGFAFTGPWLQPGIVELEAGAYVLIYDDVGYRKSEERIEPYPEAFVVRVGADATWRTVSDDRGAIGGGGSDWALQIKDRLAAEMEAATRNAVERLGPYADGELVAALEARGYKDPHCIHRSVTS